MSMIPRSRASICLIDVRGSTSLTKSGTTDISDTLRKPPAVKGMIHHVLTPKITSCNHVHSIHKLRLVSMYSECGSTIPKHVSNTGCFLMSLNF